MCFQEVYTCSSLDIFDSENIIAVCPNIILTLFIALTFVVDYHRRSFYKKEARHCVVLVVSLTAYIIMHNTAAWDSVSTYKC